LTPGSENDPSGFASSVPDPRVLLKKALHPPYTVADPEREHMTRVEQPPGRCVRFTNSVHSGAQGAPDWI